MIFKRKLTTLEFWKIATEKRIIINEFSSATGQNGWHFHYPSGKIVFLGISVKHAKGMLAILGKGIIR